MKYFLSKIFLLIVVPRKEADLSYLHKRSYMTHKFIKLLTAVLFAGFLVGCGSSEGGGDRQ
jgi:hypothetical protein